MIAIARLRHRGRRRPADRSAGGRRRAVVATANERSGCSRRRRSAHPDWPASLIGIGLVGRRGPRRGIAADRRAGGARLAADAAAVDAHRHQRPRPAEQPVPADRAGRRRSVRSRVLRRVPVRPGRARQPRPRRPRPDRSSGWRGPSRATRARRSGLPTSRLAAAAGHLVLGALWLPILAAAFSRRRRRSPVSTRRGRTRRTAPSTLAAVGAVGRAPVRAPSVRDRRRRSDRLAQHPHPLPHAAHGARDVHRCGRRPGGRARAGAAPRRAPAAAPCWSAARSSWPCCSCRATASAPTVRRSPTSSLAGAGPRDARPRQGALASPSWRRRWP